MLKYKIASNSINTSMNSDYTYMINCVMRDYNAYFAASDYLQKRYDFCMQAIYSCLGKVNNLSDRKAAYLELSRFLEDLRKISGMDMEIVNKEKLYVKAKVKRLH